MQGGEAVTVPSPNAAQVWRENPTLGVPATGTRDVIKSEARDYLIALEQLQDGIMQPTAIPAATGNLDIIFPVGLSGLELWLLNLRPTTAGSTLHLRGTSDGSTFVTATDYRYMYRTLDTGGTATIGNSASASSIPLMGPVDTTIRGSFLRLDINPTTETSFNANFGWKASWYDSVASLWKGRNGFNGTLLGNLLGVRLYFDSDTFASGGSYWITGKR